VRELNSRKSPTARKILFSEDSRFETATEGIEGGIDVVREDVICVHEDGIFAQGVIYVAIAA
jgi:hypothetical protein